MSQIDVEERETLSTSYTNTVNNRPAGQREREDLSPPPYAIIIIIIEKETKERSAVWNVVGYMK